MNPRDRLQYALYLQRLHELFVIKENIAFQYPNAHYNKAAEQIDKVVDKCLDNNIKATVDGTHNLETPNLDHVITEALSSQQKMLVKTEDKFIDKAVRDNTKEFTRFIQNRIEKENYSLQAKIQKEYEKKKYQDMSEEQAKKLIRQKFQDSARKRSKNIVKDALHTNESHISWIYNVNYGMKYKVWMNGQGKAKVRPWHQASLIQPCYIDDYFDILWGSYPVQMMYPGDLKGGAENVANCKCWVRYTNVRPKYLKVGKNYIVKEPPHKKTTLSTIPNRIDKVIRRVKNLSPFKKKYAYDPNKKSYNIPKKYKQFKGITKNGLLPNGERISKYFSKDVTKTTIFDRLIDEWTCTSFDKEMRKIAEHNFDIDELRDYLINLGDYDDEEIIVLLNKARTHNKRMKHLMNQGYLKEDIVLYRQQENLYLGENPQIGKIVNWDSYNSTSLTKEGLNYYDEKSKMGEKWEFTILAPKGTKGVYISPKSCDKYAPEMEFIFNRNTNLEILDINPETKTVLLKVIV